MSVNIPKPSLLGIILLVSTHSGPQLVFQYPSELSGTASQNALNLSGDDNTYFNGNYYASDEDGDYDDEASSSDVFNEFDGNMDISFENLHLDLNDEDQISSILSELTIKNYYLKSKLDLMQFLDLQEKIRHMVKNRISEKSDILSNKKESPYDNLQMGKTEDSSIQDSPGLKKLNSHISDTHRSLNSRNSYMGSSQAPKFNSIFGLEPDYLSEMLCPPKSMCNTRFEIMIDNIYFLGLPIHRYDNGLWSNKPSRKFTSTSNRLSSKDGNEPSLDNNFDPTKDDYKGREDSSSNSLNMFHLAFVMNPPVIENNYRIDEMYHYVIYELSMVLRREQQKHNYVWNQVKLISKYKEEYLSSGSTVPINDFLIKKSPLCKMIAECFNLISRSKIADLVINNKFRSFQIPIKTEFQSLPNATVPYLPGSRLYSGAGMMHGTGLINVGEISSYGGDDIITSMMINGSSSLSANMLNGNIQDVDNSENGDYETNVNDIVHYAILLLDDPKSIIKDIKAEPQSILASFIYFIKPVESIAKLFAKFKSHKAVKDKQDLNIEQIKSFAFHLIYWRRAIIIPPISIRSVYIVSPMAPIASNLYQDITTFKRTFSTLPSLSHFLKLLSSPSRKPRPFISVIPSKDHREIYLNALSWLIRKGYVTQLHTFIWLKISRKIKMKVEEDIEMDTLRNKRKLFSEVSDTAMETTAPPSTDNTSKKKSPMNNNNSYHDPVNANIESDNELTEEYFKSIDLSDSKYHPLHKDVNIELEEDGDTIILDPGRATTLERQWIHKIISEECKLSPELTKRFYEILKYMNGRHSLEILLMKESISRFELRDLLLAIEPHIVSVRHW